MEAMATEAQGLKGMDRRNFLKGGIAAVAGRKRARPPIFRQIYRSGRSRWVQEWCQNPMVCPQDLRIYSDGLCHG
jgi:hypothetical protein